MLIINYGKKDNRPLKFKVNGAKFIITPFLILLLAKLFGIINWSWWWITIPLWYIPSLIILLLIGALIGIITVDLLGRI